MSHLKIKIKKGKSKLVEIYEDYVIKKPLNNHVEDDDLFEYLILGLHGKFENVKEIFFWETVKKYSFLKESFAEIFEYELGEVTIKAEKLTPVSDKYFYENFFILYKRFYFSKYFLGSYLDNHTIDNYENYGFDRNNNLKLLDYSFVSSYVSDIYGKDLESINSSDKLTYLQLDIFNDIQSYKIYFSNDLLTRLTAFVITLRYHNNLPMFYYYSYKYKLLSIKEIWEAIWSK